MCIVWKTLIYSFSFNIPTLLYTSFMLCRCHCIVIILPSFTSFPSLRSKNQTPEHCCSLLDPISSSVLPSYLTLCFWSIYNMWMLSHALLTGHVSHCFRTWHPAHAFVSWSGALITSRLLTAWCRMFGSQVTNKYTSSDPLFLDS